MKKTYSVTVEDEAVIAFVEEMCKRYRQPKSRILLAGLYAFMKQQAIPNAPELGLDLDLTYGDIVELKTRMDNLEVRMSEFQSNNCEVLSIPKNPKNIKIVNRPTFDNEEDGDNYMDDWFEMS